MVTDDAVVFSDDAARVDRDWLWSELVAHTYWAKYRTREMFDRQLDGAWRTVGAYRAGDGAMIGFCRAVSDGVAFAYLADVYVARDQRGHAIGKGLLRTMIDDGPGREFRWALHTADAHGLYSQFGFAAPDATYMERPSRLAHIRD